MYVRATLSVYCTVFFLNLETGDGSKSNTNISHRHLKPLIFLQIESMLGKKRYMDLNIFKFLFILTIGIMITSMIGNARSFSSAFSMTRMSALKKHKGIHRNYLSAAELHGEDEEFVDEKEAVPLYIAEGLFAVYKPLDWTSNDVVSYIRNMLEQDARRRGADVKKRKSKKGYKVGHGGTLDPLAEGVMVLGVGSGTKNLQNYLNGSKKYKASVQLGYETNTLDLEGNVTMTHSFDHVTKTSIQNVIPKFTGKIMQVPPIFSAIRKDGKRLYKEARAGKTIDDIDIEAREVEIYNLTYIDHDHKGRHLPFFGLNCECGGGTYIRSLVRDIGRSVGSLATMTSLERTQQGQFTTQDAIPREEWSIESIYAAIEKANEARRFMEKVE